MDILDVFLIKAAVCMAGLGCALVGLWLVLWKMERYENDVACTDSTGGDK